MEDIIQEIVDNPNFDSIEYFQVVEMVKDYEQNELLKELYE